MPEILYDLPEEEYHATTGLGDNLWVTRSMLKTYLQSPEGFRLKYIEEHAYAADEESEDALRGVVFEQLFFGHEPKVTYEPDLCWSKAKGEYVPWNYRQGQWLAADDPTTTVAWRDQQRDAGVVIVKKAFIERQRWMVDRFRLQEYGRLLFKYRDEGKLQEQVTLRWVDEPTGLRRQARLDFVVPGILMGDLKSTMVKPENFPRQAHTMGWDIQQADYQNGYEICAGESLPWLFAVSFDSFPFVPEVISLPKLQRKWAGEAVRRALDGIAAGNFSSDRGTIYEPELPAYLLYAMEDEE